MKSKNIRLFEELSINDIPLVGGKNASLGEMIQHLSKKGINVPAGFAITSSAYWDYIYANKLKTPIENLLNSLDRKNYTNLKEIGASIRELILKHPLPSDLVEEIKTYYNRLGKNNETLIDVAVRSSATAEDLPNASFAGQHDSFLNVVGEINLMVAIHQCYSSLFNDRAIKYREDKGFDHMKVGLSVGVQKMVRSDKGCAGVGFTLEPESGFRDVIHLSGVWGLGENIVQGNVIPDEFLIFKPSLTNGKKAIINKKLGKKASSMIYSYLTDHEPGKPIVSIKTPEELALRFVLNDDEITTLAQWALMIENHYNKPMDFEWAKDGFTNELFIVQARPETVHSSGNPFLLKSYTLKNKGKLLLSGNSVGNKITSGVVRLISSPDQSDKLKEGEIIVTETTNPDWNTVMKKAKAIITDKGGRTSHASIVARELGIVAAVGTEKATATLKDGQKITIDCHEGGTAYIYEGELDWEEKDVNFEKSKLPQTNPMLILGDPSQAFKYSFYPSKGIGLMRLEFIISNSIQIHPMALARFDTIKDLGVKKEIEKLTQNYPSPKNYFIEKLSHAVATIAAAFFPREVIVRMSDFKTNEYANLLGGQQFEEPEENPMIGFRGASRYYHEKYKDGFRLECEAMKVVRNDMGLTNVKLMIPFCRTVEEGKKVISLMEEFGLKRKENGLEIYVMVEIPSNVILADDFAKIFDGFSIGSNDLTQLILGIDRDSAIISGLFSEQNPAVLQMIKMVIEKAKKNGIKVGLCGQAPSDSSAFASFLVEQGIDSISFTPDALLNGIDNIIKAENDHPTDLKKTILN